MNLRYKYIMSVLILKNIPAEGPGTIAAHLDGCGIPYRIVHLTSSPLPDGDGFDTLIMLGGPMSVNEESKYPYLTGEMRLAERFMKQGKKVFGVCLGAQLMAKALGARIYPGQEQEVGWYDIECVDEGPDDPHMARLFSHPRTGAISTKMKVFHWHGETFDIPAGADRLAASALYPNQAFRYGTHAYAFQFHIEVTREILLQWLAKEPVDLEKITTETDRYYDEYSRRAESFYSGFFSMKDRTAGCRA